jgi:hypothetical protein
VPPHQGTRRTEPEEALGRPPDLWPDLWDDHGKAVSALASILIDTSLHKGTTKLKRQASVLNGRHCAAALRALFLLEVPPDC